MNIELFSTHNEIPEAYLVGKNVIVIDVLRATSVIVTALGNGAKKIRTTTSIEDAFSAKERDPSSILGGERQAKKIPGFDFGNSPLEYSSDKVKDKIILLSTTNGSQAIKKADGAKTLIAAAFLNLHAVVDFILETNKDFSIICSGTNGNFSLDDGLCACLMIHELRKRKTISSSDFAELLALPFKENQFSLKELVEPAFHLALLRVEGHQNDIDFCLTTDSVNTIPVWQLDGFVARNEEINFQKKLK
jgi:2-phosphosulfolactate phosphatase